VHTLVEVSLEIPDVGDVADRLWAAGAVGVEQREATIVGAFADADAATLAADVLKGRVHRVPDTTGLDAWRDHAAVVTAGPFAIRPPWLDPGPGCDVVIDPHHTFGSGSHPSSRLALELLAPRVGPGTTVIDLGAGSGVLSIAAAVLGATVTAIDHDPGSAAAIADNASRNGVADRVTLRIGDLTDPRVAEEVGADVALLNVTIDIHERVAPLLRDRPVGLLIVAGILAGPQEERCSSAHGRVISDRVTEGEWAGLVLDHGATTGPS
jgi:ribosomal protein L11 methyltransferase